MRRRARYTRSSSLVKQRSTKSLPFKRKGRRSRHSSPGGTSLAGTTPRPLKSFEEQPRGPRQGMGFPSPPKTKRRARGKVHWTRILLLHHHPARPDREGKGGDEGGGISDEVLPRLPPLHRPPLPARADHPDRPARHPRPRAWRSEDGSRGRSISLWVGGGIHPRLPHLHHPRPHLPDKTEQAARRRRSRVEPDAPARRWAGTFIITDVRKKRDSRDDAHARGRDHTRGNELLRGPAVHVVDLPLKRGREDVGRGAGRFPLPPGARHPIGASQSAAREGRSSLRDESLV